MTEGTPTQKEGRTIIRPVEVLVGIRAIAAFLKVSQEKVRGMELAGAPIHRDEAGVARAEKAELWAWWGRREDSL